VNQFRVRIRKQGLTLRFRDRRASQKPRHRRVGITEENTAAKPSEDPPKSLKDCLAFKIILELFGCVPFFAVPFYRQVSAQAFHDQAMFAAERTSDSLTGAAFRNALEGIPFQERITHPGGHGYPDATFDYLFGKSVKIGKPIITQTAVSDHFPVTCGVEF
jgi:hypothetical protein